MKEKGVEPGRRRSSQSCCPSLSPSPRGGESPQRRNYHTSMSQFFEFEIESNVTYILTKKKGKKEEVEEKGRGPKVGGGAWDVEVPRHRLRLAVVARLRRHELVLKLNK